MWQIGFTQKEAMFFSKSWLVGCTSVCSKFRDKGHQGDDEGKEVPAGNLNAVAGGRCWLTTVKKMVLFIVKSGIR